MKKEFFLGISSESCMIIIVLIFFIPTQKIFAAPEVSNATGVFVSGQVVNAIGNGFGVKNQTAPVYWNNLENETLGSNLPGWSNSSQPGGIVSATDKWSGNKSLYFGYKNSNWNHILRDLGAPSDRWFFHFKVKMVKNDTNSRFQWKSWRISSSPDGYAWNTEDSTSVIMNDLWWSSNPLYDGWYNNSVIMAYNNGGVIASGSTSLTTNSAILFNQWQTLEQYVQMSSVPSVSDAIMNMWRNGNLVSTKTNFVSHDAGSGQWRYMLLGQSINNELDANGVDATGICDVDIWYDDIYIDNTQARIELCDSANWANRTHCEIQIPTAWSESQIQFNLNQGSFADGSTAYLYVVDENGAPNTAGYQITLDGVTDMTAPSAPSGLFVQ